MWTVLPWIAVGLTLSLFGGLALTADSDGMALFGVIVLILGGVIAQIGVIGLGVAVGLRAHAMAGRE